MWGYDDHCAGIVTMGGKMVVVRIARPAGMSFDAWSALAGGLCEIMNSN
jgi:hypothetical protein